MTSKPIFQNAKVGDIVVLGSQDDPKELAFGKIAKVLKTRIKIQYDPGGDLFPFDLEGLSRCIESS